MEVLIFVLVIVILIVVHEFGHFIAAKLSGMRVDEFGIGYPPRAARYAKIGETEYTLNWLPFGGFVKIYGEDKEADGPRAFSARPRTLQAFVLVAGVLMNVLLAYVLITGALMAGTPRALTPEEVAKAHDVHLAVSGVLSGSPAQSAGVMPGDLILGAEDGHYAFSGADPDAFTSFVSNTEGNATVALTVERADGTTKTLFARPAQDLIPDDPSRYAIGVEVAPVGVLSLPLMQAITLGAELTWGTLVLTAQGLWHFFYGIFTFSASLSQVAGPVGIAGAVGNASAQGLGDLLSLMAIISINLALINLIPVPALDGGRLLFVLIEGIIRRPIRPAIAQTVNGIGFALLILLMVVVTAHDIFRLVG